MTSRPLPFTPALPDGGLLSSALVLQRAAASGELRALLRGKNIGLLSETPDSEDAQLFRRAAAALGAQVALIRPSLAGLQDADTRAPTLRMLGRLYDALACQALPPALLHKLREQAGVPIYEGIAAAGAPQLAGEAANVGAQRLYLVQARLLETLGRP